MNTFQTIDTAALYESPLNPRKHFNQAALDELTASIAVHGVLQPLLVRPDNKGQYEIVNGARRYRAAIAAGLAMVPAMIREMTDEQLLEAAVIENLQRSDLHPLEEAEGYERMMRDHGYSADSLAEKIGKSRSYIFGRMKLLDLSEDARRLFYAGTLNASTALLVARIPTHKLQAKAIEDITETDYHGDAKSVRAAGRWIRDRYMLRLSDAPFPIDDGELIALAGPCGACPKRTGNAPELFDDIENADTCTDPDCFASKKMAAAARRIAQAGSNVPVITGEEAEKIMPAYTAESRTHVKLDSPCYDDPDHRTYREIMADDTDGVAMIEHGHKGELVEVVPKKVIAEKLKAAGVVTRKEVEKEDNKKLLARVKLANHWRDKMFKQVRQLAREEAMEDSISALLLDALPIIALRFLTEVGFDRGGKVCGLWGAVGTDNYARFDAFKFGLPNLSLEEQFLFILDLALISDHTVDQYNVNNEPGNLITFARALEIDPDALLIEAKEEIKAAELAKKPKKTPKKSRSVPSDAPLPPTEAAQAGDQLRAETAGVATNMVFLSGAVDFLPEGSADRRFFAIEAAPAGGENPLEEATAEEQSSASVEANETPSNGVPGFAVGDTVLVLDVPSPDLGIPPGSRGKGGEITMIYLDGRRAPIVVMIEGDELLFDPVQLQRIAWREEKAIETDAKPSGSTRTPVKYRHPENNELEWSGRGRKPKWVEHCLTNGMTLQQLEIAA